MKLDYLFYIKFLIKHVFLKNTSLKRIIDKIVPENVVIDIGASYYPHKNWWFFLNNNKTIWVAIDPNDENLDYSKKWRYKSKLRIVKQAISEKTQKKLFYKTNVDSGSSFLRPEISQNSSHRENFEYFFPLKKFIIKTLGINDLLSQSSADRFIMLKLDIQGYETKILKNINKSFLQSIFLIEVEQNFNLKPSMIKTEGFYELQNYLEKNEFEILDIEPIYYKNSKTKKRLKSKNIINEANIIFSKSQDFVLNKRIEDCFALISIYYTLNYYEEILGLCEKILKLKQFKSNHNEINNIIRKII